MRLGSRRSKEQFHAELQLPRIELIDDAPEGGTVQDAAHDVVIRMIEDIEKLEAKLQMHTFIEREAFREHKIEVGQARSDDCILADIAQGSRRRCEKSRCVEEAVGSPLRA